MNRPPRLSRRTARLLLDGRPVARAREQRLARLLDALADQDTPCDAAVPGPLLEAFARRAQAVDATAAAADRGRGATGAPAVRSASRLRSRRISRVLTFKAAFVLAFSGATVAAAAADVLPAPAQSAVHELFGAWGVPAPAPAARAGRVQPQPPSMPGARPGLPTGLPTSRPAAPERPVAAGKDGPAPRHPANSNPAAAVDRCVLLEDVPKQRAVELRVGPDGRLGPGPASGPGRGCTGESGVSHPGGAGGGPVLTAPSGEPGTRGSDGGAVDPRHRHRPHPRRENCEH